ncbi:sorting nexin-10A-like isoform X1 [Haliotis rufescens]|uniref:sorting nexin-10A-like isoform X1 n=1 Tax=Haliotis rufescens TaxID=6454 RepID=UPI00201F46E3|nr:sorting nexin-10A-like isoform X1 [Haliotis rufescens]
MTISVSPHEQPPIQDVLSQAHIPWISLSAFIMIDFSKCPLPQVRVQNPVTHHTWDEGRYTTYDITIQTAHKAFSLPHTSVRRRFSEFDWLRKQLKTHHPIRTPPDLPPKKFFIQRFDDEFIQKRQEGLEKFLNTVIAEKLYLSDSVLHLFLQTDLTGRDISDFISGKLTEEYIQSVWKAGGKKKVDRVVRQSPARLSISIPNTSCDSALSDSVLSADSFVSIETSDVDTSGNSSLSSSASEDENSKPKGDNSQNGTLYPELRRVTSRDFRPSSHYSINSQDGLSD